jgi:hypothetical protein
MDIEVVKLVAEVCILPVIGFFSTLTVAVVSSWLNYRFAKSIEERKRETTVRLSVAEPRSEETAAESKDAAHWIGRVFLRGTIAVFTLSAGVISAGVLFFWIRPSGVMFILNRVNELQEVPAIQRVIHDISSFIAIETLANLYLLVMATLLGSLVASIVNSIVDTVLWILDVKQ